MLSFAMVVLALFMGFLAYQSLIRVRDRWDVGGSRTTFYLFRLAGLVFLATGVLCAYTAFNLP